MGANPTEFKLVLAMNPAAARLPDDRARPGALPHHQPPQRRAQPGDHLHAGAPTQLRLWLHFLVNTPTIVATVDAALATVIVMLVLQAAQASRVALVAGAALAFPAVWATLLTLQRNTVSPLRHHTPRFPTPPKAPGATGRS